jgi:hypothetical protein
MNKHAGDFGMQIVENVRALVADSRTDIELIHALNGVHPIEIKDALVSAGEDRLLERAFCGLNISVPVLKEISRDDNPVLSFWPFTSDCAHQISATIPNHETVALLGVPTVFGALSETSKCDVTLFDNDNYLFRQEAVKGYIQCDVLSETAYRYENKFDLVVGDPPWYFDEYRAWLLTAVGLARPGGTVIFVLFPPNIRNTSNNERNRILRLAKEALLDVEILHITAEYETPSFEQIELIRNGIAPVNWRRAQFIKGRVPLDKKKFVPSKRSEPTEVWIERRIGCGRIFVKNEAAGPSVFLETANPQSRFLSSPSRRNFGRKRSNVVSSRGHGLCCSDPELLLQKLESLHDVSDIETIGSGLDEPSAFLLGLVVNDLWPRFITV